MMSCKTLITIRLLLYLCCFHKVESAAPSFTVPLSSTPHGSVDENSSKDISILTVEGTDTDGDTLRHSLVSQTPTSPPFSLDSITGLLKTPTGLDAEFSLTYNFTFGLSDGSTTVNSVVYTLNINDINEFTPEFQETTISVSLFDSVSNGYLVYDANATDGDVTANVITYSLKSGNVTGTFSLDSSDGTITVLDRTQLNATLRPSYSLIIQASDGTHNRNLTVLINVTDPPTIKLEIIRFVACTVYTSTVPVSIPPVSVKENSPTDVTIMTVEAASDKRNFSIVSQTPTSPIFILDSFSGQLSTPTGLDAEFSLAYIFTFGVSNCSTTVYIVNYTVNIIDINEFKPEFEGTANNISLLDSVSNGYLVYDANATDGDVTATVTYSLISGNVPVTFSLDPSNGTITVFDRTQLNPTSTPSYSLIIQASDGTKTNNRTVSVNVKGTDKDIIIIIIIIIIISAVVVTVVCITIIVLCKRRNRNTA